MSPPRSLCGKLIERAVLATKLGYRVEETREGDNLRLVLVRRTY